MKRRSFNLTLAASALALSSAALAQTKWDLPAAYPSSNFHTVNLSQFAADIDKASGGKLKITVHANASLFKAPEIKRAVQGGQATARIAELVGAQPVTVQAAEVSQAFATGVAESMMSSGSTGADAKLYEHVKYWYDTQAWLPKNLVLVNRNAFNALDKATQDVVLKAAAEAEARGIVESRKANVDSLNKLKAGGMQILPPSAALTADMKKVGEVLLKEWLEKAGPEGKTLIDAFQKP